MRRCRSTASVKEEPKEPKATRQETKNDPHFVAAARELRDRWLGRVNADSMVLTSNGEYDMSKLLASRADMAAMLALPEAA